jgi:hypothetical protein
LQGIFLDAEKSTQSSVKPFSMDMRSLFWNIVLHPRRMKTSSATLLKPKNFSGNFQQGYALWYYLATLS